MQQKKATRKVLLIGGSGFLSGTLAAAAVAQGDAVWALTRGQRPLPAGVRPLVADRQDSAAVAAALGDGKWDLAVDCIGYQPQDAVQDLDLLATRVDHLVFVSTDFVFDPRHRVFPQPEASRYWATEGYGFKKRQCELALAQGGTSAMAWTVVRPCHIYGPGSLLGCLPHHGRDPELVARMKSGEPLQLAGGGHFLQQPVFAPDLARTILSLAGNQAAYGQIFGVAGPDIIESRQYYEMIARILGLEVAIEEVAVQEVLRQKPAAAPFLCHRIYGLDKLAACGAEMPTTPIEEGLRQHVESLLA